MSTSTATSLPASGQHQKPVQVAAATFQKCEIKTKCCKMLRALSWPPPSLPPLSLSLALLIYQLCCSVLAVWFHLADKLRGRRWRPGSKRGGGSFLSTSCVKRRQNANVVQETSRQLFSAPFSSTNSIHSTSLPLHPIHWFILLARA